MKVLAILLGIVVGFLLLLALVLTFLIDPNRYRDDLARIVKEQTGRTLRIDGDLKLSLFPWLGLKTQRLELSNAPGFGSEPFAQIANADIRVELLPLLRRQVVVEGVRLNGLALHLARDRDGRTNWADLTRASGAAPAPAPQAKGSPADALAIFTVRKVEVTNAELTWRDATNGTALTVRELTLTSGNILGTTPVPLSLAFTIEAGMAGGKPQRERLELHARLHLDPAGQALNVPEMKLALGELKLNSAVTGKRLFDAPSFSGRLDVARFDARALMTRFGVGYQPADADALRAVSLGTRFNATSDSAALEGLDVRLDNTHLAGQLGVRHFAQPAYRFDLDVDQLDLDRYLPAASEASAKHGKQAAPATKAKAPAKPDGAAQAIVIPLALLRSIDAQGKLDVQSLKAMGVKSQAITLQVAAKDGKIALGPNRAKLYGGEYAGRTTVDASANPPRFQFDEKLTSVQLGPFLKDAGVFDRYSGTGQVELKLTARGLDAEALTRTLNGSAAVQLRNGKVEGVNLQKLVQQARALYDQARGRQVRTSAQPSDETAFESLTASFRVTDGVARNDDLKLVGPVVRATGQGSADLVKQVPDYKLMVTVAEGTDQRGTTVPVHIGGTFAKPEFDVDYAAVLKEQAGQSLEKKLKKKLAPSLEKLRQKLR